MRCLRGRKAHEKETRGSEQSKYHAWYTYFQAKVIMRKKTKFNHTGSSFDSFLEEQGIREEVDTAAIKRVIAWQLSEAMKAAKLSKKAMAERIGTSRSQLDRLLDPENSAVHLQTIARAARAVGKRLRIEMVDAA